MASALALQSDDSSHEHNGKHRVQGIKALYRSFMANTFEWVLQTTPEGVITFCNALFCKDFGFAGIRSYKSLPLQTLLAEPDRFYAIKEKLLHDHQILNEVIEFQHPGGKVFTGLFNCQLYEDVNKNVFFNWTVLNISDRVKYERSLKENNTQLQKVNMQMERFLYSTSHDLRSPITSILGLVNLVSAECKEKNILDYISKIEQTTLKLDKIIRDIISFSKATYQHIGSEKIQLIPFVWSIIHRYHSDPNYNRISFEINIPETTWFYSDQERLQIIFDSLIRNAIQFTDLNKSHCFVSVNAFIKEHELVFEVHDNGIGIGKQYIGNIFNMFFKASTQSRGAGLGLYIVKQALEQLKGTIEVESEVGFGSVFRVVIPNHPKAKLINRKLQLVANRVTKI